MCKGPETLAACSQHAVSFSFSGIFVTGHSVVLLVSELGFVVCGFLLCLEEALQSLGKQAHI